MILVGRIYTTALRGPPADSAMRDLVREPGFWQADAALVCLIRYYCPVRVRAWRCLFNLNLKCGGIDEVPRGRGVSD
jgi:hypothetical protein